MAHMGVLLAVLVAGCDDCGGGTVKNADGTTNKTVEGAVLRGPADGRLGQTVEVDATGSKLGSSGGPCPQAVYFYSESLLEHTIKNPKTDSANGCALVDAKIPIRLAPGPNDGKEHHQVSVYVEAVEGKELLKSRAEITVVVHDQPPVVEPPRQFTSTGGGDDHGGDDGHGDGHEPIGERPAADFVVNPMAPVAGSDIELDARLSSDPDGDIVAYRWDLDDDGQFDDNGGPVTSPEEITPAGSAGPRRIGLEVTDNDGNTAVMIAEFPVQAAGRLRAKAPNVAPSGAVSAGSTVWFYLPNDGSAAGPVAGADQVLFDGNGDRDFGGPEDDSVMYDPTQTQWFDTKFDTPGIQQVTFQYIDFDSGTSSQWTTLVDVTATRRGVVAFAAKKKGKKKAKAFKTTGTLSADTTIVDVGRLSFQDGALTTEDAIVRGTMRGALPRKKARKAPKALKGLLRSEFVGEFSGERVPLTPEAFSVAGEGTIVARPVKNKKTLVCLSVETDGGATPDGSSWKVIGATGKAKRWTGSGTFAPVLVGMEGPEQPNRLAVKRGPRKGLTPTCKTLAKQLPGAKKSKKKKGKRS